MAIIVKAPHDYDLYLDKYKIFLAGAIDMGAAEDWQTKLSASLEDLDVCLLNPRRNDWDSSWVQEKTNPQFREQVEWEQHGLNDADLIVVVFTKDSKAPITLFELGLHIMDNVLVCCPTGFYRKGNVDIVCEAWQVPVYETIEELILAIRQLDLS